MGRPRSRTVYASFIGQHTIWEFQTQTIWNVFACSDNKQRAATVARYGASSGIRRGLCQQLAKLSDVSSSIQVCSCNKSTAPTIHIETLARTPLGIMRSTSHEGRQPVRQSLFRFRILDKRNTLPTLFSAYVYGRRHAVLTATASIFIVVVLVLTNANLLVRSTQFVSE
jgi:hypothetical protein